MMLLMQRGGGSDRLPLPTSLVTTTRSLLPVPLAALVSHLLLKQMLLFLLLRGLLFMLLIIPSSTDMGYTRIHLAELSYASRGT